MSDETPRERTWRERREAEDAIAEALDKFSTAETAYNDARLAYHEALNQRDKAVRRNVEAWKCSTCHAHYDQHARTDLSCPAYTTKDGSVVFSDVHRYTELT